jgi:glycerophosphoryl diester phosphodiesterase
MTRRRSIVLGLAVLALLAVVLVPAARRGAPAEAQAGSGPNVWLDGRRIANMAHGGGLHEVPQGTMYAYETAAARGATALEMDLHVTLDGHVVAIHDSTVDRTTDGTGCVVAKTLAELKALDAAHTFVPGEGPRSGRPVEAYTMRGIATGDVPPPPGFTAEDFTIATLEEIFQSLPDATMVMELKPTEVYQSHDCPAFVASLPPDERPDLPAEVARLIDEYGMADKVMVASFIDDLMARFQALAPDVDTSFPLGESLAVYTAFLAGDPLPNPNGHEAFQVPRAYGPITITREIAEYARAHDVAVHFWTINDPAEMAELLDWGVDGLITDEPQVLAALLVERGDPQPVVGSTTGLVLDEPGPTPVGEPVELTATVGSAWPHPEVTGTVELRSGDAVLATAPVAGGEARFSLAGLGAGSHELQAAFTGSARVLASASAPVVHQVEVPAPTTTATSTTSTTTPTGTAPAPPPPPGPPTPGGVAAPPAPVPASAGADQGRLPATGGDLSLAGLGVGLLAAGVALVALARRGRRAALRP